MNIVWADEPTDAPTSDPPLQHYLAVFPASDNGTGSPVGMLSVWSTQKIEKCTHLGEMQLCCERSPDDDHASAAYGLCGITFHDPIDDSVWYIAEPMSNKLSHIRATPQSSQNQGNVTLEFDWASKKVSVYSSQTILPAQELCMNLQGALMQNMDTMHFVLDKEATSMKCCFMPENKCIPPQLAKPTNANELQELAHWIATNATWNDVVCILRKGVEEDITSRVVKHNATLRNALRQHREDLAKEKGNAARHKDIVLCTEGSKSARRHFVTTTMSSLVVRATDYVEALCMNFDTINTGSGGDLNFCDGIDVECQ